MADFLKNVAGLFPGPSNPSKYLHGNGLTAIFPFYHAISDRPLSHTKHLYPVKTVRQFAEDLEFLLRHFTPVRLTDYLSGNVKYEGGKLPMVLSFDDGLIQCYSDVLPLLIEKGVPAVFFVNNEFIDNKAMFYRFKVSLLVEKLDSGKRVDMKRAAELLHCNEGEIRKRLMSVSYVEREITDQVAGLWQMSFDEYMRQDPVYLSSMHIRKMLDEGFEIGSHGIDHPLFALLTSKTTVEHVSRSMDDLIKRYRVNYRYFAFPFTDYGVQDKTIDQLFKKGIIDAGFGTAGLKDDKWEHYFQRIPMELPGKDARKALQGEMNSMRLRKLAGRNLTRR